jgi:hypothetical protein
MISTRRITGQRKSALPHCAKSTLELVPIGITKRQQAEMSDPTFSSGFRLQAALGFGPRATIGTGSIAGSNAGAGAGAATGSSAGIEVGASGLGVDEYIDPNAGSAAAGVDTAKHSDMNALPGNVLNAADLLQLREHNHTIVREQVRRSGDRRALILDTVGLELMQALQKEIERAHFSQASAGHRLPLADAWDGSLVHSPLTDLPLEESVSIEAADEAAPPTDTLSERARAEAADQRESLLMLVGDAQVQAAQDLAALNRAEGVAHTLRDLQVETNADASQPEAASSELRADRAEEIEAQFRAQSAASLSRATRVASATQGRRLGLQNSLRGRAPR